MRICLYEDRRAADLYPLTLTPPGVRPALRADHARREAGAALRRRRSSATCAARRVADVAPRPRPDTPGQRPGVAPRRARRVLVNAPLAPAARARPAALARPVRRRPVRRHRRRRGRVRACSTPRQLQAVSPGHHRRLPRRLAADAAAAARSAARSSRRPWELIDRNADELARDFEADLRPDRRRVPPGRVRARRPGRPAVHPPDRARSTRWSSPTPPAARS